MAETTDKAWADMTPAERRADRIEKWRDPGVSFVSAEAEADYKARVDRLLAVINLQEPDRVPVSLTTGWFPAMWAGITPYEAMSDAERGAKAYADFTVEFGFDHQINPMFYTVPTSVFETIDYKLYNVPGYGVAKDVSYQYNEKEWMLREEYDHLISDPTDYMLRVYLPRTVGAFAGFANMTPLFDYVELPFVPGNVGAWGTPEIADSLARLQKAGAVIGEWFGTVVGKIVEMMTWGFPGYWGGSTKAPFDLLGDTLRGTRGVITDLYRCPDKVLAACERLTQVALDLVLRRPGPGPSTPVIFIPLHKGADGFMSDEQFRKFYWPSLQAVITGLIDEGFIVFLFAEGGYNTRLEIIKDVPKGGTIWLFDQTDMGKAKATVGKVGCIEGNVPLSLLHVGTEEDMVRYVRGLIDTAGKGGGFILDVGAVADGGKVENLRAMIKTAHEYGRY